MILTIFSQKHTLVHHDKDINRQSQLTVSADNIISEYGSNMAKLSEMFCMKYIFTTFKETNCIIGKIIEPIQYI